MTLTVFDYAGPTGMAYAAAVAAAAVGITLLLLGALWLGRVFRRPEKGPRFRAVLVSAFFLLVYMGTVRLVGPSLDHAWLYLTENARRTYCTYAALTWATAFFPPSAGGSGRQAFVRLATRDSGFAKGRPVSSEKIGRHVVSVFQDEDYAGNVTTLDGRPVMTGTRFQATRILTALVPLFGMPTARSARVTGAEAFVYSDFFRKAGLSADVTDEALSRGTDTARLCDIVLVAPEPDWIAGSDMPDAAAWRKTAVTLTRGGVAALHLDARLLSLARLKGILDSFREVFGRYQLWCVGRHDYVVTSAGNVLADEVLDLFARAKTFEPFASAGIFTPGDFLACLVGTDRDVAPALETKPAFGHVRGAWTAPRLAFSPPPTNALAAVDAAYLTPYYISPADWLKRGLAEKSVFTSLTNRMNHVQAARREILVGFTAADAGSATNALKHWAGAAKINPSDPLLANLADAMDLEGRRYLRIGNVNGAIRCYENRLSVRPKDVAAIHNFGVCLTKCGHPDMAARVFAKAVELDPLTDEHRMELIEAAAASEHEDIAVRQLEVLMRRHPNDPGLMMRTARLLCVRQNPVRNETRAVHLAEEAVRLTDWKDRSLVEGLADVYISAGRALMGMGLKKRMRTMKFDR